MFNDEYPLSYGTVNDPRPSLELILSHLPAAAAHGPARKAPARVPQWAEAAAFLLVCWGFAGALVMPA